MDKLKQWVAFTVIGVLVVLAAGWFLLVTPKRTDASHLRDQASQQVNANSTLETQLATLKAQAKDLPRQQAKLAAVAAKIPNNPALPELIRSLTVAASDTGVELVSLSPTAPMAVAAPVAVTPVASAAGAQAPVSHTAAATRAGLQQVTLTLSVVGAYFQVEQFLDRAETLTRALKVTGLNLAPGTNPMKPALAGAVGPSTDPGRTLIAAITSVVYVTGTSTTTATTPVVVK